MRPVPLLSLATAVPPYKITQGEAKELARGLWSGRRALFDRLATTFDNAGIANRYLVAPAGWYAEDHGWHARNSVYLEAGEALFREAASKALDAAGLEASDIDGIVTVSTTGIATPSLEARVGPAMGFRPDARRFPIFGLGCAGGVSGLAAAARLAAAEPASRWLFVTVETCSISIRLDSDEPSALVATALFGDGAAAAVVGGQSNGIARIAGSAERLWADTLDIMGWRVEDPGLAVIFDRAIPPFIEAELASAVDSMLIEMEVDRAGIDRMCSHPGGAKVIEAIESAMGLQVGMLDLERQVLRDYGNMSAPTVMFVLDLLVRRGLPPHSLLTAFGPGFTCSSLLLEQA